MTISRNTFRTALRLRPTGQMKKSTISNAAIQNNEFAVFIDTKNKIVTLPEDVKAALKLNLKLLKLTKSWLTAIKKSISSGYSLPNKKNPDKPGFKND